MYRRLRDLREDHDLTQAKLSKILFMTQNTYSIYERGVRQPPIELFVKLADYYGTSVDYLLGRTNNPNINR